MKETVTPALEKMYVIYNKVLYTYAKHIYAQYGQNKNKILKVKTLRMMVKILEILKTEGKGQNPGFILTMFLQVKEYLVYRICLCSPDYTALNSINIWPLTL